MVGLQAPLSFLNAPDFRGDVMKRARPRRPPKLLVLEASGILEIDFTAAQTLLELIKACREAGRHGRGGPAGIGAGAGRVRAVQDLRGAAAGALFHSVDEAVRKLAT